MKYDSNYWTELANVIHFEGKINSLQSNLGLIALKNAIQKWVVDKKITKNCVVIFLY